METVACLTSEGQLVSVPASELHDGVIVYGILIENQRVLLRRNLETGLWEPPGGHLVGRQVPEQAVRSLFRAQTGLVCDPQQRLLLESQHRIDVRGEAWRFAVIYYALQRNPGSTVTLPPDDSTGPAWVQLEELRREEVHAGYEAIQVATEHSGVATAGALE